MSRKKYTPKFKIEAVRLVTDIKYTVAQAAREAEINESLLSKWKRQYLAEQNGTIPSGSNPIAPDMQYIRALENRIRELEEDNEILKKATAILTSRKHSVISR
ncbi:transposase [Neisseria sp. CCUG17229]|uniref:transposase n=1 Tax=Neisseria sp. CCUG17229 TaxID=3392036 RepID=UPI003A101050